MINFKKELKKELYSRWGDIKYPSEWDGNFFGGGKGSQRFWEYLWTIEQLNSSKKIFDVGCGQSKFFPRLLEKNIAYVYACDPQIEYEKGRNTVYIKGTLEECFDKIPYNNNFNTITCVSVLEHIEDHTLICKYLSKFTTSRIICTLEYGFTPRAFNYQVIPQVLYKFFSMMPNHYIEKMELCPVYCEDSHNGYWRPLGIVLDPK